MRWELPPRSLLIRPLFYFFLPESTAPLALSLLTFYFYLLSLLG
jgi:hypothetical protein